MDVLEDNIQMYLQGVEQASTAEIMIRYLPGLLKSVMKILWLKAKEFLHRLSYYQPLHPLMLMRVL
jgi:hypothetical protein